jgi:hypothetical protein
MALRCVGSSAKTANHWSFSGVLAQIAGTIARFPRDVIGLEIRWRSAVLGRETKFQPERVMADLYLGVTVAGI